MTAVKRAYPKVLARTDAGALQVVSRNGANNGYLALSARDAAERVGCSKNTASRAFAELVSKGFVAVAQRGHFDRKNPHAAEYRLTLYECHRAGERATRAFMSWLPTASKI
jgi:DNA-binding IclR family transcriptional regulator